MDVLDHDLETIEATRFRNLDLATKTFHKVLIHDPIGSGEESEDVGDEVTLVIVQAIVPVVKVFGQVDFLSCPEGGLGLLVHLPDLNDTENQHISTEHAPAQQKTTLRVTRDARVSKPLTS